MKVLLVIDSLSSGGAQNQMVNLCRGLAAKGIKVDLLTYFDFDFFEHRVKNLENVKRIKLKKKSRLGVDLIFQLRKLIRKGNYDIALSYLDTPNFYLSLSNFFSFSKCKAIISYRNSTVFNISGRLMIKVLSHLFADQVIYNSFHERDAWSRTLPFLKKKMLTIYNGIDTERFKYIENRKFNHNRMISVSSVIPRKNVLFIIEAIYLLKTKYNRIIEYYWIGSHVEKQNNINPYFEKVKNLINEYDLKDQWHWIPPTKKIEEYYTKADALILASTREGVPNVVCEAMATGLPAMASNVLDNPYLLKKGQRGFLFDLESPDDLAKKIDQFYKFEKNEIETLSQYSSKFINEEMSINKMDSNYLELFKKIIKQ